MRGNREAKLVDLQHAILATLQFHSPSKISHVDFSFASEKADSISREMNPLKSNLSLHCFDEKERVRNAVSDKHMGGICRILKYTTATNKFDFRDGRHAIL